MWPADSGKCHYSHHVWFGHSLWAVREIPTQAFLLVCAAVSLSSGAFDEPFPMGHTMGSLGTIMWEDGAGSRDPTVPASFIGDTSVFGFSLSGIDYYDRMDNFEDNPIRRGAAGFWVNLPVAAVKLTYLRFNALDMYYEQSGVLSAGTSIGSIARVGGRIELGFAGLKGTEESELSARPGLSAWIPLRYASLSLNYTGPGLGRKVPAGFVTPPSLEVGLHTNRNRFGAHGTKVLLVWEDELNVGFQTGLECRLHKVFAVSGGVGINPLLLGFGATISLSWSTLHIGLVYHPMLGWSEGIATEYIGR